MIQAVDLMLCTLLQRVVGSPPALIGLQPPDARWSGRVDSFRVNGNAVTCLNVFLADLRENRVLRNNAVAREVDRGAATVRHAPVRVDLHYLISAWHPIRDSDAVPATTLEHNLLTRVVAELAHSPLNSDLILSATQAASIPDAMRSVDLPSRLLPVEGFPRLGEFWASMGHGQSWRPSCYLVVTVPVTPEPHDVDGIVETIIAEFTDGTGPYAASLAGAGALAVGGIVSDLAGAVPGVRVALVGRSGAPADGQREEAITDPHGRFAFAGLPPGPYDLVFTHPDHPTPPPVSVVVPLSGGHLDLVFP